MHTSKAKCREENKVLFESKKKTIKKEKLVGKISHYFGNIKVAVIELSTVLKVGDTIHIIGGEETDFTQNVKSIEVEYKKVKVGKKGESVGIKAKEKVREGYRVFKV